MISFVIPTLNEGKVLAKTLDALTAYTGDYEIIISDGNSHDDTLAIATRYHARTIVHRGPERQTISQGRNDGAELAQGEMLAFLDADVIIPDINQFMTKALNQFQKNEKLVGLTVSYRVLPELETWADFVIFKLLNLYYAMMNNVLHLGGSGGEFIMVKKDVFEKIKGFDPKLAAAEDNELFYRLVKMGRTESCLSLTIYHTGRRGHKIGWPRLLWQWGRNYFYVSFLHRSADAEWTEVR